MELVLERNELAQLGTVSFCDTMKLVAGSSKTNRQRIVVGDDHGFVECFEMKRGERITVFRTKVAEGGEAIQAVAIGGVAGKMDRFFAAYGQTIVGLQRKGKSFFKMQSSLVEPINHMCVDEQHLFTGCEYVYNKFNDGNDDGFYMCHDKINALLVERGAGSDAKHTVVLGCQDRCVRVVRGSELAFEAPFDAAVTALERCRGSIPARDLSESKSGDGGFDATAFDVFYGCASGQIGLLRVGKKHAERLWFVDDVASHPARVNCLSLHSLSGGRVADVAVGRSDGRAQVYVYEAADDEDSSKPPALAFEAALGEAIHSLQCGRVSSSECEEMVVCTFAGRVASFSNENPAGAGPRDEAKSADLASAALAEQHEALRNEVEALEAKAEATRGKFNAMDLQFTPAKPDFEPRTDFTLDAEAACYVVKLELPVAIDIVALKSSVRIELVDTDQHSAIVATSPVDDRHATSKSRIELLATFRCQDNTNSLAFKVRTVEGEPGDMSAIVVARGAPKSAQVAHFRIKALSLHRRVHELTAEDAKRPKNALRLRGDFSAQQIHDWIAGCLPDVPPRAQIVATEAKSGDSEEPGQWAAMQHRMCFRNVYTDAMLECNYQAGEARICSDSISAIAILKEHMSREAVRLRVVVHDTVEIKEETVPHFLKLIDPKLTHQLQLAQKVRLIDAVKEIHSSEDDTRWLSPEYAEIFENAEALRAEAKNSPTSLQYITGIITDFFVDRLKFCGIDARHKIPDLERLVERYDYDQMLAFFNPRLHRGN